MRFLAALLSIFLITQNTYASALQDSGDFVSASSLLRQQNKKHATIFQKHVSSLADLYWRARSRVYNAAVWRNDNQGHISKTITRVYRAYLGIKSHQERGAFLDALFYSRLNEKLTAKFPEKGQSVYERLLLAAKNWESELKKKEPDFKTFQDQSASNISKACVSTGRLSVLYTQLKARENNPETKAYLSGLLDTTRRWTDKAKYPLGHKALKDAQITQGIDPDSLQQFFSFFPEEADRSPRSASAASSPLNGGSPASALNSPLAQLNLGSNGSSPEHLSIASSERDLKHSAEQSIPPKSTEKRKRDDEEYSERIYGSRSSAKRQRKENI